MEEGRGGHAAPHPPKAAAAAAVAVPDRIVADPLPEDDGTGGYALLPPGEGARPPAAARNELLESEAFEGVHRTAAFEADPPCLDFEFDGVGTFTRVLRVLNVSSAPQRMHVLPPDAAGAFSASFDKRGFVMPGMAQEIRVMYRQDGSSGWEAAEDRVRLHCSEGGNLVVPLRAYPVLAPPGRAVFPSRVDLGNCVIGQTVRRTVRVSGGRAPVQFQYRLELLGEAGDFEVGPLEGVVPPGGVAEVGFSFTPTRRATAELRLRFSLSQFGFAPVECAVVASATTPADPVAAAQYSRPSSAAPSTSTAQERDPRSVGSSAIMLRSLLRSKAESRAQAEADHPDLFSSSARRQRLERPATPEAASVARLHRARPRAAAPPAAAARGPRETVVDGVRVPADLNSTAAVSAVLRQTRGKTRARDAARRRPRTAEEPAASAPGPGLRRRRRQHHPLDYSGEPCVDVSFEGGPDRASRELAFVRRLAAHAGHEKMLEVTPTPRVGQALPTDEQAAAVREELARRDETRAAEERARDMARPGNELVPAERARATVPAGVAAGDERFGEPAPADLWAHSSEVVRRFVSKVTEVALRQRVEARLGLIKEHLAAARASAGQAGAASGGDGEPADRCVPPPGFALTPEALAPAAMPQWHEEGGRVRPAFEVGPLPAFGTAAPAVPVEPLEWRLLGYEREPAPAAPEHVEDESARPLLVGALDETELPPPAATAAGLGPLAAAPEPEGLREASPAPPLSLLRSVPGVAPVPPAAAPGSTETALAALLPPDTAFPSVRRAPGSGAVSSLRLRPACEDPPGLDDDAPGSAASVASAAAALVSRFELAAFVRSGACAPVQGPVGELLTGPCPEDDLGR